MDGKDIIKVKDHLKGKIFTLLDGLLPLYSEIRRYLALLVLWDNSLTPVWRHPCCRTFLGYSFPLKPFV